MQICYYSHIKDYVTVKNSDDVLYLIANKRCQYI